MKKSKAQLLKEIAAITAKHMIPGLGLATDIAKAVRKPKKKCGCGCGK